MKDLPQRHCTPELYRQETTSRTGKTAVFSVAYPLSIFLLAQFNLNFFSYPGRNILVKCMFAIMDRQRREKERGKEKRRRGRRRERRGKRTYSIGPGYELVVEFL